MLRRFRFFGGALLFVLAAFACGEEIVIPPPSADPDTGTNNGTDAGTDGNQTQDGNGGADTADVICPTVAPDESAVFVATTGSVAVGCGTRIEPCKTITQGITRASALAKNKILVARGVYVERVQLKAGMRIEGGWDVLADGTWNRACVDPAEAVIVRSPAGQTTTIVAKDLGGKTELALLRVESKPQAQVGSGDSLAGITATGGTTIVALEEVIVDTVNAGAGKDGTTGTAGADPAAAGSCAAGTGANGVRGTAGAGAPAGTFDQNGYTPEDGDTGGISTNGAHGTAGGNGSCVTCGACTAFPACVFVAAGNPSCGTAGKNGCGGGAGGPGTPGSGGGSSIGLYAWDATITIAGGRIRAGNGGNGGAGGNGGNGKGGSAGIAGTPTQQCVTACAAGAAACIETKAKGEGGNAGGIGGSGGPGAFGGGGSGGSSYAIYQGGAAIVTVQNTTLQFGSAGKGADAGPGANGAAAARFP